MPAINEFSLAPKGFLFYPDDAVRGSDVLMAASQTSSITPTWRHPPGTVLIKKTSSGKYYLADDVTNADNPTAASVATLVTNPGAGGWDGNLIISGHWGSITVALSGDNTDAAVAAAIIAAVAAQNPETQARITAADTTGEVTITNFDVGSGTWLSAYHATVTTMFGAAPGVTDNGEDPDVRVTTEFAELQDLNGTARDHLVPTLLKGKFKTSQLSHLTAEARGVLERRGSSFH